MRALAGEISEEYNKRAIEVCGPCDVTGRPFSLLTPTSTFCLCVS